MAYYSAVKGGPNTRRNLENLNRAFSFPYTSVSVGTGVLHSPYISLFMFLYQWRYVYAFHVSAICFLGMEWEWMWRHQFRQHRILYHWNQQHRERSTPNSYSKWFLLNSIFSFGEHAISDLQADLNLLWF